MLLLASRPIFFMQNLFLRFLLILDFRSFSGKVSVFDIWKLNCCPGRLEVDIASLLLDSWLLANGLYHVFHAFGGSVKEIGCSLRAFDAVSALL